MTAAAAASEEAAEAASARVKQAEFAELQKEKRVPLLLLFYSHLFAMQGWSTAPHWAIRLSKVEGPLHKLVQQQRHRVSLDLKPAGAALIMSALTPRNSQLPNYARFPCPLYTNNVCPWEIDHTQSSHCSLPTTTSLSSNLCHYRLFRPEIFRPRLKVAQSDLFLLLPTPWRRRNAACPCTALQPGRNASSGG